MEDGKCANVNEELEMYNKCKSVPKCNRFAENIFEYTDGLTKCRHSISTLACEACTIFANKNGELLSNNRKSSSQVPIGLSKSRRKYLGSRQKGDCS